MGFFSDLFKDKTMREMEQEERQAAALENLQENITTLTNMRNEYAELAAQAELEGDTASYEMICSQILDLMDNISFVRQTYTNYKSMVIQNTVSQAMVSAVNSLAIMSNNKANMPDVRALQKMQNKINGYMKNVRLTNKSIGRIMKNSNPAVKPRTAEELASVRPMIDAARSKMVLDSTPRIPTNNFDLTAEIESAKNNLVKD